jgi:hypothetical protein
MIDEFRRRTNATYDEARYYIERNNGDLLEAIIAFERDRKGYQNNSAHPSSNGSGGFVRGIARLIQKLFDIKLVITDKNLRSFHIPVIIPIALLPVLHIMVLVAIIMMFMGYKFGFQEIPDPNINVESIIDKIKNKVREGSRSC